RVHDTHRELHPDVLLPFVNSNDERLNHWNLGVVTSQHGTAAQHPLGPLKELRTVRRARLNEDGDVADIKALMSKQDVLHDVVHGNPDKQQSWEALKHARRELLGEVPLLLLYPINRQSEPERGGKSRVALDAVHDVLGFGVVFPGTKTEGGDYVSVELEGVSAEEIAAIEAEERTQMEVAGVDPGCK
ncbi:MAG: beta-1,4-mannanase, partial [Deltaproteobacteria bacterium]